jgi:hypothetical protein
MHMHFSTNPKSVVLPVPICGYVGPDDDVCRDASLCTCPECLDWIRPDHDQQAKPAGVP